MIKGIRVENIKPKLISPHCEAKIAFEYTRTFQFQVDEKFLKPTLLGHGAFEMPLVVSDQKGGVQLFAGWKYLLPPFSLGLSEQPIPILVFPFGMTITRIAQTAWQYAFHLALSNLHEDGYLASTALLLRQCPIPQDILMLPKTSLMPPKAHLVTEKLYGVNRRRVERQEESQTRKSSLGVNNEYK
jgi:hypothetical protein